jgi:hypothetical protein
MNKVPKPEVGQVYLIVKESRFLLTRELKMTVSKVTPENVFYDYSSKDIDYFKPHSKWEELIQEGTLVLATDLMKALL